jgi:divalent metal cation (Fe/Co/Zn/Cd) transporter
MTLLLYIILGVATGIKVCHLHEYSPIKHGYHILTLHTCLYSQKVLLYFYCITYAKRSPTLEALAEDHRSRNRLITHCTVESAAPPLGGNAGTRRILIACRNDVLSNTVAICTAFVATWRRWRMLAFCIFRLSSSKLLMLTRSLARCNRVVHSDLWWVDPVGAVVLSVYIVFCWTMIATEQINQMVGSPMACA